jgi:hypothetical protein
MTSFSSLISTTGIPLKTVSIAIRGYGYLAPACKRFLGDGQLVELLNLVIEKSALFFFE